MSNATVMLIATAPAKVQSFLTTAHDRGLTVSKSDDTYVVSSPNPIDDFQLWFHHTDGANGGRLNVTLFTPAASSKRSVTKKVTQKEARLWIGEFADGLDRYVARENNRILTNLGTQTAAPVEDPFFPPAVEAAIVAKTTTPPAPVEDPALPVDVEAELVVAGLRANARFVLRAARHGHIQRNTPTKVRAALINRGLIQAGGGILTDLGRAARHHLVSA